LRLPLLDGGSLKRAAAIARGFNWWMQHT